MTLLAEIVAAVVADVRCRQRARPLEEIKRQAADAPPPRDGHAVLSGPGVHVIAEIKRRSPWQGELAPITDPAALAAAYEAGGASVVSVVTEGRYFGGCHEDLRAVRARVEVPVLCKDFVLTAYQLWEARLYGADLVLLRAAALDQPALVSLVERAESVGLTAVVDCRREVDVARAVLAGARVIGINARDFRTLAVDRSLFAKLAPLIPDSVVKVAESGVRHASDVFAYARAGADAVLIGEAVVRGRDPRAAVADLAAAGAHPAVAGLA